MDSCNCANCANNTGNEKVRAEAVSLVLNRNRAAFRPKIGAGKKVCDHGGEGERKRKEGGWGGFGVWVWVWV